MLPPQKHSGTDSASEMSSAQHSYGPSCRLAAAHYPAVRVEDDVPVLQAQFFYTSPLAIDDPLSPTPSNAGLEAKASRHPPRPFSSSDNRALEEAWQGLVSKSSKKNNKKAKQRAESSHQNNGRVHQTEHHEQVLHKIVDDAYNSVNIGGFNGDDKTLSCPAISATTGKGNERQIAAPLTSILKPSSCRSGILERAEGSQGSGHTKYPAQDGQDEEDLRSDDAPMVSAANEQQSPLCCEDMDLDGATEEQDSIPTQSVGALKATSDTTDEALSDSCPTCVGEAQADGSGERSLAASSTNTLEKTASKAWYKKATKSLTPETKSAEAVPQLSDSNIPHEPPQTHTDVSGTTGFPFVKMPSRSSSPKPNIPRSSGKPGDDDNRDKPVGEVILRSRPESSHAHERETTGMETEILNVATCKAEQKIREHVEVPVGISRLHSVILPKLLMQPIYWSPVHDIASVTRATWFYKDSMYPVDPVVANQLESGYRALRPWSQTWKDELTSAMEVGAAGEEKIAHCLWTSEGTAKGKPQKKLDCSLSCGPCCAAKCFQGDAAAEGSIIAETSEQRSSDQKTISKRYANAQVIYKDTTDAFILKPNLQPSVYYGRKPLQKIWKGTSIGIPVIRGFTWATWDKIHPSKRTPSGVVDNAPVSGDADLSKGDHCQVCRALEHQPKVTDLILVIHGIGQKLSERVESFHFTHAVNDFRRRISVECADRGVQRAFRQDLGGIMALPVNWRSNLSFEDGGLKRDKDKDPKLDYSLHDVTQDSLPTVRKMISDVMLDIPYYMSAHKPKMIQAVIQEANRVYQLWCKNNPDFESYGRVHIIAHSLGSAMSLEILSKQPTLVPKHNTSKFSLSPKKINSKHFDFNTINLFFVGSPVGFFLLLEQRKLIPRRGQKKPGAEVGDDHGKQVVGDAGTLGCMAVHNVYNVMAINDPIAYRLNPTIDKQYAESLKVAHVPSTSITFLNAMLGILPGVTPTTELPVGQVAKPSIVARLPSQLEMEVHDFTHEEVAEKKFCLLNDNGQVDWLLNSGRGPLEIQYINMLSAHSSYWLDPDFVRFLVVEIGRKPGKSNALASMKASKKTMRR